MARPLRIKYEGAFYHITARGNERKKIFFAKPDYAKFKEYLKEAQDRYGHFLHCYVLISLCEASHKKWFGIIAHA